MKVEILSTGRQKSENNDLTIKCTKNAEAFLDDFFKEAIALNMELILADKEYYESDGQQWVKTTIKLTEEDSEQAQWFLKKLYNHFHALTVQIN